MNDAFLLEGVAAAEWFRLVCRFGDYWFRQSSSYAREGAPGGWTGHYQGGPIGYAQREFEIAPVQQGSRWYATPVAYGHAVAWNPSLPGGAKAEDTYLVSETGLHRVTTAAGRALPHTTITLRRTHGQLRGVITLWKHAAPGVAWVTVIDQRGREVVQGSLSFRVTRAAR